MPKRTDELIERMWSALRTPATTVQEIATRMSVRGETISIGYVGALMKHLRVHCLEYGWNVPHVKRGPATETDEGRFFRCLVDRDGEHYFEEHPDARRHMANGTHATVKQTVTMSKNQIAMLNMQIEHVRSISLKAKLRDVIDDYSYATRKMARVLGDLDEREAA